MIQRLLANLLPVSIASTALGIVLILIAEFGDVHETRIFGATLIVSGGLGIGTHTGLADPRKLRLPRQVSEWRAVIGVAAALLMILPLLVVLGGALVGAFADARIERNDTTSALGAIIVLLLAAATITAGVVSVRAITRAANQRPEQQTAEMTGASGDIE